MTLFARKLAETIGFVFHCLNASKFQKLEACSEYMLAVMCEGEELTPKNRGDAIDAAIEYFRKLKEFHLNPPTPPRPRARRPKL